MTSFAMAFFEPEIRSWRGDEPLSKVFWNRGVFVSSILILCYADATYQCRVVLQQILLFGFAAYTVWILVSVWRCADNADPFWGLLARWLTVAWAGNTIMALTFLQLDLAKAYIGL